MNVRCALILLAFITFPFRVDAAPSIVIHVIDPSRVPISGARIELVGASTQTGTTDPRGIVRMTFARPGKHQLRVSAMGFHDFSEIVALDDQKSITITLRPSAGSLGVIGSVTGHARTPFNATPVSQKVYPREAYRDQGQPSVASVINQTPGVLALTSTSTNAAAPLAPAFPSVRNALPFETPVLIDGAPILTPSGTLDLALIPTYVLEEVEIVKGAGDVAGAGGGVGGAINFRTADPTLGSRGTYEIEGDSRGGSFTDLAYDGTQSGGTFAYATMLSIDGSPCCSPYPSDYTRKAVLVKLRSTPTSGVSITGTVMSVSVNRSLYAAYGLPGFGYEHLGFGDLTASLDRGDNAFSLRVFTAQTQQGSVSPNLFDEPAADENGVELNWRHVTGKAAFDTSARTIGSSLAGTNEAQTVSLGRESITYRPDARSEIDLSGQTGSNRTQLRDFSGASGRAGYSYELQDGLALRTSYGTSLVMPPLETLTDAGAFTSAITSVERTAGGDVGLEWRLHGGTTTLSADLYRNVTQGVYVLDDDRWSNGPPMVESGAELALQQFKRVGMGFIAALDLPRTFVWGAQAPNLYPASNLGAVFGQIAPFRIPYAQGYAELSYKWPRGSRASIGVLYVGSNNVYGAPAFATLNSNLELSLGSKAKLQFSVQNLTDQLANRLPVFPGVYAGEAQPTYGLEPFTLRFMFRQSFGAGSLYEH